MEAIDEHTLRYSAEAISAVVDDLLTMVPQVQDDAAASTLLTYWNAAGRRSLTHSEAWPVLRLAYRYGFFERLRAEGVPVIPYDLRADITDVRALEDLKPFGLSEEPPRLALRERPTDIAGHRVDFPLGLPASIIAAHSAWIEFFARRGFCILTYKTLRTSLVPAHPKPNWLFLRDAVVSPNGKSEVFGTEDYWPTDPTKASMANSFGIPSYHPEWWQADFARIRGVVREGHQVLIASVVATATESTDAVRNDFVEAATIAARAGADIVELNLSCPNTHGEVSGLLYTQPEAATAVAAAVKEALASTHTPVFVKIGYLPPRQLDDLVFALAPYIDGVVAINTMSAQVVAGNGQSAFPNANSGASRLTAGVSGWAIQGFAEQVAKELVRLRREVHSRLGKTLTVLSVGGVLTAADYDRRLATGVDAVEICTGAFLNPLLGLEIRLDKRRSKVIMEQELDNSELLQEQVSNGPPQSRGAESQAGAIDVDRPGSNVGQVSHIRRRTEGSEMNHDLYTHLLSPSELGGIGFESDDDLDVFLDAFDSEIGNANYELPNTKTIVLPISQLEWALARAGELGLKARRIRVKSPNDLPHEERVRFEASRKERFLTGRTVDAD